jgi:hypothetical protein
MEFTIPSFEDFGESPYGHSGIPCTNPLKHKCELCFKYECVHCGIRSNRFNGICSLCKFTKSQTNNHVVRRSPIIKSCD